jgi:hypothetical protein
MSFAAFPIFQASYQETPYALQILSVQMQLHHVLLQLNECQNLQLPCLVPRISLTAVVGQILPSQFHKFIWVHILLPKTVNVLVYGVGDCAYDPAEFVIFA